MIKKRYKLRASSLIVVLFSLLGIGTVSVQASTTCQRIVQKVVEKTVPRKFTQATLAKWAEWNKAHPNYHAPKRQPKLNPEETLDRVNFACQVDPIPTFLNATLDPGPAPTLELPMRMVTTATVPPPDAPMVSLLSAPPLGPTGGVEVTPEPATWLFMLTGAAFLLFCGKTMRKQQTGSLSA